jgi:hypothetical protein
MIKKQKKPKEPMVYVIRDTRDASRDYELPAKRARQLFEEGVLIQIHVYGGTWSYATRDLNKVL